MDPLRRTRRHSRFATPPHKNRLDDGVSYGGRPRPTVTPWTEERKTTERRRSNSKCVRNKNEVYVEYGEGNGINAPSQTSPCAELGPSATTCWWQNRKSGRGRNRPRACGGRKPPRGAEPVLLPRNGPNRSQKNRTRSRTPRHQRRTGQQRQRAMPARARGRRECEKQENGPQQGVPGRGRAPPSRPFTCPSPSQDPHEETFCVSLSCLNHVTRARVTHTATSSVT